MNKRLGVLIDRIDEVVIELDKNGDTNNSRRLEGISIELQKLKNKMKGRR